MVAFGFLFLNFGKWQRPCYGSLSFYECRLSGGDTKTLHAVFNSFGFFLRSEATRILKRVAQVQSCLLAPLRTTWWKFHYSTYNLICVGRERYKIPKMVLIGNNRAQFKSYKSKFLELQISSVTKFLRAMGSYMYESEFSLLCNSQFPSHPPFLHFLPDAGEASLIYHNLLSPLPLQ